jgi:hypothetical protein
MTMVWDVAPCTVVLGNIYDVCYYNRCHANAIKGF